MSSNTIVVSYQDLVFKGLINDLKQVALCDVKTLCSIPCSRCPNACSLIDSAQISVQGLQVERIVIKQTDHGELDLHIDADNILPWLKKNDISHQKILDD